MQNMVGAVVTTMDVPLGLVKDAAQLAWLGAEQEHSLCCWKFGGKLSCGQSFCDKCSRDLQSVSSGDKIIPSESVSTSVKTH